MAHRFRAGRGRGEKVTKSKQDAAYGAGHAAYGEMCNRRPFVMKCEIAGNALKRRNSKCGQYSTVMAMLRRLDREAEAKRGR